MLSKVARFRKNSTSKDVARSAGSPGRLIRLVLLGCLVACWWCQASLAAGVRNLPAPGPSDRVFEGAWFKINYPAGFTPIPSLPSSTTEGYDSAEFISPDGEVSFYIFSPQWGGEPTDIALVPDREVLVSRKTAEREGRQITWTTICARGGGYCRSYRDTVAGQGSVRTTVGIKYRSEEARHRYMSDYIRFRHSLLQFGD